MGERRLKAMVGFGRARCSWSVVRFGSETISGCEGFFISDERGTFWFSLFTGEQYFIIYNIFRIF